MQDFTVRNDHRRVYTFLRLRFSRRRGIRKIRNSYFVSLYPPVILPLMGMPRWSMVKVIELRSSSSPLIPPARTYTYSPTTTIGRATWTILLLVFLLPSFVLAANIPLLLFSLAPKYCGTSAQRSWKYLACLGHQGRTNFGSITLYFSSLSILHSHSHFS